MPHNFPQSRQRSAALHKHSRPGAAPGTATIFYFLILPRDHFQGWVFRVLLPPGFVSSTLALAPIAGASKRDGRFRGADRAGFPVCSVAATCSAWDRVIGSASLPRTDQFEKQTKGNP